MIIQIIIGVILAIAIYSIGFVRGAYKASEKKKHEGIHRTQKTPRHKLGGYVERNNGDIQNKGYIMTTEEKVDNAIKVESKPKFKVGDWIIYKNDICQIVKREEGCNKLVTTFGIEKELVNERNLSTARLWTIADAKEGDVLVDVYGNIGIYENCDDFDWMSYCSLGINGGFQNFKVEHENDKTHPATKEQRDTLFAKMREAGYEWDVDKKELSKIEQVDDFDSELKDNFGNMNIKDLLISVDEFHSAMTDAHINTITTALVEKMRENMETMLPAFPFKDNKERQVFIERALIVYEMGIKDGIYELLKTNKQTRVNEFDEGASYRH